MMKKIWLALVPLVLAPAVVSSAIAQIREPSSLSPTETTLTTEQTSPLNDETEMTAEFERDDAQAGGREICTPELIDGMITVCCEKPADPATRNCVHLTQDFLKICQDKNIQCLAMTLSCAGLPNHMVALVRVEKPEDGWAIVDPRGRAVWVGSMSAYEIPTDYLCLARGEPKGCKCDYFVSMEPGLSPTDPMFCATAAPQLSSCNACCDGSKKGCYAQSRTDAEKKRCDEAHAACKVKCAVLDEKTRPEYCAKEGAKNQSLCESCCDRHPYVGILQSDVTAQSKWIADCKAICKDEQVALPSGFNVDRCYNSVIKNPKTKAADPVLKCQRCCGFFAGPPACPAIQAPACTGWWLKCRESCKQ